MTAKTITLDDLYDLVRSLIGDTEAALRQDIDSLKQYTEAGFDTMNDRFDRLEDRFDRLESQVQNLDGHSFYEH